MDNIMSLIKKYKYIILVLLVIIIVIIGIKVYSNNKKMNITTVEIEKNTYELLETAYNNHEISTDEYVLNSAYLVFDSDKLDEKYKSNNVSEFPNIPYLLNQYENELSDSTKNYIYSKLRRSDIVLGKRQDDISYLDNNMRLLSNKKLDEQYYETTLDKYYISSNKHFVIWYATSGVEKTDESLVKEIADKLEEYVTLYKNEYGIEYKWEKGYFGNMTEENYRKYVESIAPNDSETVFNAMPVLISKINQTATDGSRSLAFYLPVKPNIAHKYNDSNSSYSGVPVGPFINIDPTLDELNTKERLYKTVAHELFHHYQSYICGNGSYDFCKENKNGQSLFELETTAEWAAVKTYNMKDPNVIANYLQHNNEQIDQINPYTTHSFLMNYETTVDNGKNIILNALREHNGDTLKYLVDNTDKMDLVMRNLAKNNLINDYKYDSFKGYEESNFAFAVPLKIDDIINKDNVVNKVAMRYLFITQPSGKFKITNTNGNDKTYLTIFASKISNITTQDIKLGTKTATIEQFNDLKVIYSEKLNDNAVVDLNEYSDSFIIMALSNGSLQNDLTFKIETTTDNVNTTLGNVSNDKTNDSNTETTSETNDSKVYDIYFNNNLLDISNFAQNDRAYVDINDFCSKSNICVATYTNDTKNKIKVKSMYKVGNNEFEYTLINEKNTKDFNSSLKIGDVTYELSQLDVDQVSCPSGIDSNGKKIPSCDDSKYYVPIRFIAQALGYDVEWNSSNPKRIDISDSLQNNIESIYNLRFVFSKNNVNQDEEVKDIIEINDNVELELNQKYYLYTVDNNNIRKYNSAISVLNNNDGVKILNEKNNEITFSSIEINNKNNITLGLVSTIKLDSKDSKSGIYPYIKVIGVK